MWYTYVTKIQIQDWFFFFFFVVFSYKFRIDITNQDRSPPPRGSHTPQTTSSSVTHRMAGHRSPNRCDEINAWWAFTTQSGVVTEMITNLIYLRMSYPLEVVVRLVVGASPVPVLIRWQCCRCWWGYFGDFYERCLRRFWPTNRGLKWNYLFFCPFSWVK